MIKRYGICVMCSNYSKEILGRSANNRSVLNIGLLTQVLGVLDGRLHSLHGQERGQVGRVRRD